MKNSINYIEKEPELPREIEEMISKTRIVWDKPKEEIWSEILDKMEHRNTRSLKIKSLHLQYFKYAAAIFILFIGISAFLSLYSIKIETRLTQQKQLLLPDNSMVTVYELSSLSYKPFIWKFLRSVKLEGDGFFEVQKGKTFEVVSDKGKTVVLGTRFTVHSRANDYSVTCKTGKVKVIEFKNHNQVTITGGQKALLIPEGYFKVVNEISKTPDNTNDLKNKSLEDELNKILITPPEKETPVYKNKIKTIESHPKAKSETIEKKTEEVIDKDKKESILSNGIQINENIADKEESLSSGKDQSQNKEKQNNDGLADQKSKFKASLTPEQISILENQKLGKEEKRKAFMQSLSPEQLQLLREQKTGYPGDNKQDDTENQELKEQQKTELRQQMQENAGKEINEQQKQQNRENKGSGKEE